jgi:hypothetical protein
VSRPLRLSLVFVLSGCQQVTRIDGGEQACVPPAVQAAFDRSCARSGCHDANGTGAGLALTAGRSAAVIDGASSQQQAVPLVVIGDSAGSYMAHKLALAPPTPIVGVRMPVGFDPNNPDQAADVGTILSWIAGAPIAGCEAGAGSSDEGVADTGATSEAMPSDSSGADIEASGLPCEIDDLLERRCRSCHSDPPASGPMPLVSRDHLLAAAPSDGTKTVGERALERMMDPVAPMPPAPGTPASAEEIAMMQAWIVAGSPAEDCGGGGSSESGGEPEPNPFDAEPMCSSGRFWGDDDDGDPRMHPGRDCLSCHDEERADDPDDDDIPDLLIAGTIYPTGHEPNDCIGASSVDLRVIVQSMVSAEEVTLEPNSSGNFLLHRSQAPAGFEAPFQVKLVEGDAERIMPIAAPHGACNRCHTQDGTMDAPGRIVQP